MAEFSLSGLLNKTPAIIPDLMTPSAFDIDGTFSDAEQAFESASRMLTVGADIQQCVPELFRFFKAQGEIDAFAAREKAALIASARKSFLRKKKSAEDEFLGLARAKRLAELETNIKDLLIYSGNSDIYKEMCNIRHEIFTEREHERIEEIKEQERIRIEQQRRREKRRERIEELFTVMIGTIVIAGMVYGIWWMISSAIRKGLSG